MNRNTAAPQHGSTFLTLCPLPHALCLINRNTAAPMFCLQPQATCIDEAFWRRLERSSTLYRFFIALLFTLFSFLFLNPEVHAMQKPKHIVLLGASVGNAWDIESLPKRISQPNPSNPSNPSNPITRIRYRFEYVGEYQFDKSNALQQILKRKENKPDAIFIKECAAYFPGDLPHYQELMKGWIRQCKESKVVPIPTTVVPVIKPDFSNLKLKLKDTIKWVLGRPTLSSRLEGLIKYNEWIRSYAQKEGLIILDLEAPLRISEKDRSLKIELHSGDGLHLNQKAYSILDQIVLPTLDQVFRKRKE